ncbi:MAG: IS110 element transposase-like pilin switch DNA invertase Piv [Moraxella equi]|nr:IS110 element transposase-like pilin switch DNA invertase Piv [Moraxella equi]
MSKTYIGIDIAKNTFDACFITHNTWQNCTFTNNQQGFIELTLWIQAHHYNTSTLHLIIEATGAYWEKLAHWAISHHHKVSIVNPLYIHAYAKSLGIRTKTDKQDAILLARYGAKENPPLWQPKSDNEIKLTALLKQREHHKRQLIKERTRQEALSIYVKSYTDDNIRHWSDSITQLDHQIWQLINCTPELNYRASLLATIPGIGKKTLPHLLVAIGDGSSFQSAKHLASYAGLAPRHHQSGISIHKQSSIGFSGQKELRSALFMPAVIVSFGRYPAFQKFVKRMEQKGKTKKQIIIAIMRKLLTISYAVIRQNRPFDKRIHE